MKNEQDGVDLGKSVMVFLYFHHFNAVHGIKLSLHKFGWGIIFILHLGCIKKVTTLALKGSYGIFEGIPCAK